MKINKMIDHTLLKADAREKDIVALCQEARAYDFASVCVNGSFVRRVHQELKDSDVKTCTVVGFPLGAMTSQAKVFEAQEAVANGADEVDMVLALGRLKSGDDSYVLGEIQAVKEVLGGRTLKVIIETSLLTTEEKILACRLCIEAGAQFVKTSTGFSTGGATVEDIRLIKEVVGDRIRIKASGGIRSFAQAKKLIEAGADRLGASSGVQIVKESKKLN